MADTWANVREDLERLQEDGPPKDMPVSAWLDRHRDDVLTVKAAKGLKLTAELLGISKPALSSWLNRRKYRDQPAPEPAPQSLERLRGQVEVLWRIVERLVSELAGKNTKEG